MGLERRLSPPGCIYPGMVLDYRHPEERLARAIQRFHDGRLQDARTELQELLALGFGSAEVYLYLGHCALECGDLGQALGNYRQSRHRQPQRAEVWLGLGVVAARRLHFRRACRLLRRALESDPAMQEAYDNLILCHGALDEREQAYAAFQSSCALDSRSPHAYFNAAFLRFDDGETEKARELWLRVVELDPDYPDAERMIANCERAAGELETARRRLEVLVDRYRRDVDALADLGYVHEEREEWQSALKIYERALEVDPEFARVRARMAGLLQRAGSEEEALFHLLRASNDDPGDARISEPLAHALNRAGRPTDAEFVLRRAVRVDDLDAGPRCARARYHEMTGAPSRAAADYKRAAFLEPNDASHLCGEARSCIAAGDPVRGRARLEYAVVRFPDQPGPYLLLADLALAQNDARAAARHLELGLSRLPKEPRLTVRLAESYLRLARVPRAIALASRARQTGAVASDSADVLGRAFLRIGDPERALRCAEDLLRDSPDDPRGVRLRGRVRLATGDPEAAAKDLRRYVRERPADPRGYRELARCLDLMGEENAARTQERIADFIVTGPEVRT